MTIGERIKNRREELGITQDELAKKLGYKSRSSINKIELNIYNLKQSKIKLIADALDTTPTYIMGWEEDSTLERRDDMLDHISGLLSSAQLELACETYDDDYFTVRDASGQTVAGFYDYELLSRYEELEKAGGLTAENLLKKTPSKAVSVPVYGRVAAGIPLEMIEDIIDYEEIPQEMAKSGEFFGLKIHGDSMEPRIQDGDVVIVRRQDGAETGDIVIASVNGTDATCKRLKIYRDGIELIANNPSYKPIFYSSEEVAGKPVRILGKVVELRGKF